MRKLLRKTFALCLSAAIVAGIATTAFALDHKVDYNDPGNTHVFTVKNAAKKLNCAVTVGGVNYPLCFEGDLNTTIDVSGMGAWTLDLLEKNSDGTYAAVMSGADLAGYYDPNTITEKADEAAFEAYFASAEFKQQYTENFKDNYPTIEECETAFRKYGAEMLYIELGISVPTSGYDNGSHIKFTKPGIYLVSARKDAWVVAEPDYSACYVVMFIGTSAPVEKPLTANPTSSKISVNGKDVAFEAYTIGENNYFKLRDIAKVLSGSDKQFNVTWDAATKAIELISGTPYTVAGGELAKGDGRVKTPTASTSIIYKDGVAIELTAYTINNNNYFKLRDLGQAFDFGVSWDGATNSITVDTATSYTAE